MNTFLRAKNVGFRHAQNGYWLFRELNLVITSGEIAMIYGGAGSGKTTLAELLVGFLKPSRGWIERTETTAIVSQEFDLYRDLTVDENLDFIAAINNRRATADLSLDQFGLTDWEGTRAAELPAALKKMLQLACAARRDFNLLILDEPTAGLDHILKAKFWEIILNLKQLGKGVLILTSNEADLEYADRVYQLKDGTLVEGNTRPAAAAGAIPELGGLSDAT